MRFSFGVVNNNFSGRLCHGSAAKEKQPVLGALERVLSLDRAKLPQGSRDRRRGSGRPPEFSVNVEQRWQASPDEPDKPVLPAAGENLGDM